MKKSPPYDKGPRLLDLMDTAIFDFIIGNADRHHYEVFAEQPDSMVLLLDNAKSFGNPEHDEMSILKPITQCCLLRKSTFERWVELNFQSVAFTSHFHVFDRLFPFLNYTGFVPHLSLAKIISNEHFF